MENQRKGSLRKLDDTLDARYHATQVGMAELVDARDLKSLVP